MKDKIITGFIKEETKRQGETINLIASENYVSREVLAALGSPLTNKYAEGYSKLRYYRGNAYIDQIEDLAKERALQLFVPENHLAEWDVNVQALSGSPANLAVYLALVPLKEKIMGLELAMGGHLTHGHPVSATGKLWQQIPYQVDLKTEMLDYAAIEKIAMTEKPKLIVAGYSAYSRIIDFKKFRQIADRSGALLMVDMSHFAGLVAGGVYSSPFLYADIVTSTTHKTLRGPRSALIFSKKEFMPKINKAVFPGLQGGPHANQIAAVATALLEANQPAFKKYAAQIIKNAQTLAAELQKLGWRVINSGTDTHVFLIDVAAKGLGGEEASVLLEQANIIVNKNTIPYDKRGPMDPSGLRLGTPALTTRGMKEKEMKQIAVWIDAALTKRGILKNIKKEVSRLCRRFPLEY